MLAEHRPGQRVAIVLPPGASRRRPGAPLPATGPGTDGSAVGVGHPPAATAMSEDNPCRRARCPTGRPAPNPGVRGEWPPPHLLAGPYHWPHAFARTIKPASAPWDSGAAPDGPAMTALRTI